VGTVPATNAPGSTTAPQAHEPLTLLIRVEGLGLFHDENLEAARLVAEWARKRGLKVVNPDAAALVFLLARAGKDSLSGKSCGSPLSDRDAATRYQKLLGATGELLASVGCQQGSCSLAIHTLDDLGFFGAELMSLASPYATNVAWRQALAQSLAALSDAAAVAQGTGGLGLSGTIGDDRVVARPEKLEWNARSARDWEAIEGNSPRTRLTLGGNKEALRRCFHAADGDASLLIQVDDHGKIDRCESRDGDADDATCACTAFMAEGHAGEALRGKRVLVDIGYSAADVVTPKRAVVEALSRTHLVGYKDRHGNALWRPLVSDPSIESWDAPPNSMIAQCFANAQDDRERSIQIRVEFDAAGKVARTQAVDAKPPLPPTERECVERVFRSSSAPCPAAATTTAQVAVQVRFKAIGSKEH
jgi:hypothetical protein